MKVIFHPTHGMNIDVELSTNARNVGPQFGPKFAVYRFVPAFRAEHHMHDVLCVGMRHVPHLRCSAFLYTTHPALTRWAKVCRASGALRSYIPRTQRLRAGLKYVAPPALERGRADTARREGTGVPAAARNLRCRGWPILAGFAPPPIPLLLRDERVGSFSCPFLISIFYFHNPGRGG